MLSTTARPGRSRFSLRRTLPALALFGAFAFAGPHAAGGVQRVSVWSRWEHTLHAAKPYDDPVNGVQVQVRYTGPGGETFEGPAFWDGAERFRLRAAFPRPGRWRWRTTCSDATDAGLHGRQGAVTVTAYRGGNPLLRHGFLTVRPGDRYLTHADGAPFLWMGDTAWNVLWGATLDEWRHYVNRRAAQGFTVIQARIMMTPAAEDTAKTSRRSFVAGKPHPEYWRLVDEKVAYANRKGMVVMLVGIGRPSGKDPAAPMPTRGFARFVAGRMFGSHVVLSPSMDTEYAAVNDSMGAYLGAATARHLITQHVNTSLSAPVAYHPKPYLDFDGMQSGHHNGNVNDAFRAAREWTATLRAMTPTKPVLNLEAMYDGRGSDAGPNWRAKDVRRLGYVSWLSGAAGYTYGAGETDRHVRGTNGGLWGFNERADTPDHWKKALEWPSARQVGAMAAFFRSIPWTRLEPAPELIAGGAAAPDSARPVLARTPDGRLAVAFLPEGGSAAIDLGRMPALRKAVWIDPARFRRVRVQKGLASGGVQTFHAPGPGDWLLLLTER